jgi:hypothetical protein
LQRFNAAIIGRERLPKNYMGPILHLLLQYCGIFRRGEVED